jgi:hypothetical protein
MEFVNEAGTGGPVRWSVAWSRRVAVIAANEPMRFHVRGCGAEAAAPPAPTPAAAKTAVEGLERAFLLCDHVGSDTDVSAFGNQLPSLSGEFGN